MDSERHLSAVPHSKRDANGIKSMVLVVDFEAYASIHQGPFSPAHVSVALRVAHNSAVCRDAKAGDRRPGLVVHHSYRERRWHS